MEIITFILALIGFFAFFNIGYYIGKFKGAKDGIDYCFEQKIKQEKNK